MRRARHPSAAALEAPAPRVHCGMRRATVSPGAPGDGGPPRRGRDAAAAIGPRHGSPPTRTHRHLTGTSETAAAAPGVVTRLTGTRRCAMTRPAQGPWHPRPVRHAGGFHYGWIIVAILVVVQVIGSAIS